MEARGNRFDLRGWLLPGGALIVAAILAAVTLWPWTAPAPAPTASPTAVPTPADEHAVTTDEGVVSFRLETGDIVVRLETASGVTELGRASVPYFASAAPGGTQVPNGTEMFALVCGTAASPDARRYVFGHLDATGATYAGPAAKGQVASDGFFLFALVPGAPASSITVRVKNGPGGGFPPDVFGQTLTEGKPQPSGCFVLG